MASQQDGVRKSGGLVPRTAYRSCDCMRLGRPSRREFTKMLLGAAAAGIALDHGKRAFASVREQSPGLKLCQRASLNPSEEEILFLKQLGFENVFCATPKLMSVHEMSAVKQRYAAAGITLDNIRYFTGGNAGYKTMADILLGTKDVEQAIADAKTWITNSGAAGFYYTGSSLGIAGIWEDDPTDTRGAKTRDFDASSAHVHSTDAPAIAGFDTPIYGRRYTREEVLGNFKKYFVAEIVPVAERSGVCIGFHPDDVPVYDSIAACLASSARWTRSSMCSNSRMTVRT